ncbi:hypothetical protein niasHS_010300 [Heterodera schachtii]|uniref:Moesin/ezrin/radixin homolog 1 n=1 Tax=Heterodera schachtii TaxID=97005 RepID=A0ABD2J131_HETSC
MAPGGGFLRSLSQRLTGNKAKQRRPAPPPAISAGPSVAIVGMAEQQHHHLQQQQCSHYHQQMPTVTVIATAPNVGTARRGLCQCRVQLLDRTYVDLVLPKSAQARELYERVFAHMELEERDYFGLQFTDHFHVHHWLDPSKKIRKQMAIGPPYTFRLRVKFFSSEPANLREELTRYQFFLQLRHDIQTGRLDCPREAVIDLAALALQSEFGDFSPKEHSMEFVSEFRFHPAQDEHMERDILHSYATKCSGMSPSQAELAFLNNARLLDFYGVDMHPVEGRDGNTYRLGLTPVGMQVFDGRQKIGLFVWEKIQRLDFRGRKLTLVVEEDLEQPKSAGQLVQLHTFVFELSSHKACKHLWKCAIEYHTFYRLKYHLHTHHGRQSRVQLFRLGSTFRHRGRTEYEALHREELVGRCAAPSASSAVALNNSCASDHQHQFARRASQRYAPRHRLTTAKAATTVPTHCDHHPQPQQQAILMGSTGAELSATMAPKATKLQMPSANNNGTAIGTAAFSFHNGTAVASSAGGFGGDSSPPCRTSSSIPVPSSSFSSSANSALKKGGTAYDTNNNGTAIRGGNERINNEYVTTIQINRAAKDKQRGTAQPTGERGERSAISRIPSLITSPATAAATACQPTKFLVTNCSPSAAAPPLPSHQQRKCTQIPVISGSRMASMGTDRGMATEL